MTSNYDNFLNSKRIVAPEAGFDVAPNKINKVLFPFQRDITRWAIKKGRAAILAGCGMGKTGMHLEWQRHVIAHTGKPTLTLAPLAVTGQTEREGKKFGIPVTVCETMDDVTIGVNVTNYEKLHRFDPDVFGGICCDESSIMKSFEGVIRRQVNEFARGINFRLACTATPSPNDLIEIINHAEFLDVMNGKEIIALYFKQDGNTTHKWKLRDHARKDFFNWLASWAVAIEKPSDLGYSDEGYLLPPLRVEQITVNSKPLDGMLFATEAKTLKERRTAKKDSLHERVEVCRRLIYGESQIVEKEKWVIWCNLDAEQDALEKAFGSDAVSISGSTPYDKRIEYELAWREGDVQIMITKPKIFGFGLNWQHCARMAFVGLSDSFEELYQATRRLWRFGQKREVVAYHVASEAEGSILSNIRRKEDQHAELMRESVEAMKKQTIKQLSRTGRTKHEEAEYKEETARGEGWTLHLGDSVKLIDRVEKDSVGLWVFSPPFPGMYAYSNSARDIGNCESIGQMIEHFRFLLPGMLRATMPGRTAAVHLCQVPAQKSQDGYIGLKDFRGRVINLFEEEGWIYTGEVTIDKNPQVKAARTKERGLLFKTLATDSGLTRPALADYLLIFRKPGENPKKIRAGRVARYENANGWITENEWIEWAAPVWYRHLTSDGKSADIQPSYPALHQASHHLRHKADGLVVYNGIMETDVLNTAIAKEPEDARHLCPLQLSVCERAIKLWSAPGDLVASPFNGIGSAGVMALLLDRQYLGIELKRSYWKTSQDNFKRALRDRAEMEKEQTPLFAAAGRNYGQTRITTNHV
jgi:DNA modification methylase